MSSVTKSKLRLLPSKKEMAFTLILTTMAIVSYCQLNDNRLYLGRESAEKQVRLSIKDSSLHNVLNNKTVIIKDSLTAIGVVEPILFGIYGKRQIVKQQPYEIYHIGEYWFVKGTLR